MNIKKQTAFVPQTSVP